MKFLPSKLVLLLLCNCGVVPQILGQEETTPSTNVPLVNSADIDESMLEEAQSISLAFRKVAQKTLPATVKVIVHPNNESMDSTKSPLSLGDLANNFSPQDSIEGGGSGFIVDPSGVIVTNNHVLAQSDVGKRITIELNDGRQFDAKEIYHDEKGDLAVVTIEASEPLPSLTFADSDLVNIGDWALAVGNPFLLGPSVSAGVISAKERMIENDSKLFIQTDAAVNPGNSGGPLVNLKGEVIGVNTAIASLTGGYQGIGFAIPSNQAKWIYRQLYEKGKVERAFLGAPISPISLEESKRLGIPFRTGIKIGQPFQNTPAAKANLRSNDVLLELDGKRIDSPQLLIALVERADLDRVYVLKVLRNATGALLEIPIKFEIRPDNFVETPVAEKIVDKGAHYVDKEWGLMLIPATPEGLERVGAQDLQGVIVLNSTPGGAARRSGIKNGAVILKINGQAVGSLEDYIKLKNEQRENTEYEIEFVYKQETKTIRLEIKK